MAVRPVEVDLVDVPVDRMAKYRECGWCAADMLDDLVLGRSAVGPDRCAAVSGEGRLRYAELASALGRAAWRLGRIGVRAGNGVLVQLPNDPELLVLAPVGEAPGDDAASTPRSACSRGKPGVHGGEHVSKPRMVPGRDVK